MSIRIAGVGVDFPGLPEPNPDETDAWVREHIGIAWRNIANTEQVHATSGAATGAAINALLATEQYAPEDVNLIVLATASPDRLAPSSATRVQNLIGATNAAAFDINAVCSGWLYGLTIASKFIETDASTVALVIGADTFSRFTDWDNRDSVFFGDGAGAVVVTAGTGGFQSYIQSDGRGWDSWSIPGGGSEQPTVQPIWEMVGRDVYDKAIEVVPDAVNRVLAQSGYTVDDIDYFVPHQASLKVLKEVARRLEIPWGKVATNLRDKGNTGAASIPTALHTVADDIQPGDVVVFAAVGAGWTWGAAVLEWS